MNDFYSKFKDLFEGGEDDFRQNRQDNSQPQNRNFKDLKGLFEGSLAQPYSKNQNANNAQQPYFSKGQLDEPSYQVKPILKTYDSSMQPYSLGNASSSGNRPPIPTFAANAERMLMKTPDYRTANNPNRGYDNQPQLKPSLLDQLGGGIQGAQKYPQMGMREQLDNSLNKSNQEERGYTPVNRKNINNTKENQILQQQRQLEAATPIVNVSKQKKYLDLHGGTALYYPEEPKQQQQQQSQQQSSLNLDHPISLASNSNIPRKRQNEPVDISKQQHFEERNQGLLDILFVKRRFADHKTINEQTSGIPGGGQYRQALLKRLQASKKIEVRREALKKLLATDRGY